MHLNRILKLGFGKDIEEILELLGSRQNKSVSEEKQISKIAEFQRQNLLLSATLNDKVNNLAKISLENPIMIGLDDKTLQISPSLEGLKSLGSDVENEVEDSEKIARSSNDEYKLASLGACCEKFCFERTTLVGWPIVSNSVKEEEEGSKSKGTIKKEEGCQKIMISGHKCRDSYFLKMI